MPNLMGVTDVDAQKTLSNFEFSGKVLNKLGASEYTVACIAVDVSPSVSPFKTDLIKSLKNAVQACEKSPRSENMLVRASTFCESIQEVHGFVPLKDIKTNDYDQYINIGSCTNLYDATLEAIEACKKYGESLFNMDYLCNAIVFVITDGMDISSRVGSPIKIAKIQKDILKEEKLESLKVVLIGVGEEDEVRSYLENFKNDAGLDQFVWVGEATSGKLAKLASFVSQSISSTSQALGTGGTSQDLTF